MKRRVLTVLLVALSCLIEAGEVRLANDSPFPLVAQVSSASGKVLGTIEVPPGETVTWEGGWSGSNTSETPYGVRWLCKNGGKEFSACTFVGEGALVSARTCPGSQTCPTKQKEGSE